MSYCYQRLFFMKKNRKSGLAQLELNCTMPMIIEDIRINNSAQVDLKSHIATKELLFIMKNKETGLAQLDLNCLIPT